MSNQEHGEAQGVYGLRPIAVVVRAYADEPVKLEAVGFGTGVVTVRKAEGLPEITFPSSNVYKFDPQRYADLVNAFTRNDGRALASLWYDAERFQ